ncbi:E3 ubiquitin-protein ligase SspH2 [Klebsiella sp. BIGb0407]|nr:E3 ubiquitin-protein ligase SspH2 [Klebsiella sp. BIGb0407]
MKEFFGHIQQPEALEYIRMIYHPPLGTARVDVFNRFEQLKMLVYYGYEDNIQSGRHGRDHFCILDASNHEMLSVTLDDTGGYTVECDGDRKTYTLATTPSQTAESPSGLHNLGVSHTPLTSLPELQSVLRNLQMNSIRLTSLPELPSGLQRLEVNNTSLTSQPELQSVLRNLQMNSIRLTSLPELPSGLQRLEVNNTSLTSLTERITGLPTQEARLLHLAVADWLAPVNEGQKAPSDRWQNFAQQDDAASFSRFLDRLSETKNVIADPGFKTQIASWLTDLAEDDELRAKTFAMATEAASTCEDRVTLTLNHMKNVQLVHRAEKGEFDNNRSALVSVAREMFRLDELEKIARKKASTLRFVDEIEVYLAYQNKLKEALELTCVAKEMQFFDVANVTESDLKNAEIQVKAAENSEFMTWILQWAPLHSMLQRTYPADWQRFSEQKISDYNDEYRTLSGTRLELAGLSNDDDAVRAIGVEAMAHAENKFRERLNHLVNQMLAGSSQKQ